MARRRWSQPRQRPAPAAASAPLLPRCTPEDQVRHLVCGLCGREAKGFGYVHGLRFGEFQHYRFCSMACCKAGSALARRSNGLIDKTPMEARAIKDARRPLAEVLQELGLLGPFHNRSAAEIDRIIEACVDGFQASMQRQAAERDPLDDPIPF
ncbi:DUF6511 domain-containing protein [Siccirubricoccus sp. KC 17139]|uniref:DUF6511 domain-containing protein n=1 Tax=Siccirubricoccus soli TaxID=2899147 RepID=A0ABT1CZR2_9PROT|nr:DUF6511 domain-containing protein [Siccirubricoccus soli]MCO6415156.1 DUF6511 domain-containing protein [Siccirubricoccus soli]MCP2681287.1 DUF6511 domain-containing protein [Siccirubricoccus soli]